MLYNATVMPYARMLPPLFPWSDAGAEEMCKSRTRQGKVWAATEDVMLEGGFGRVPSLGSCLGHPPCVQ